MKIFGFLQVRNEVESGHLARFLSVNADLWDVLFAIDDGSTDSTVEVLESHGATVIRNTDSEFGDENRNKERLLRAIDVDAEPGDAILWLDADEVLFASRGELEELIRRAFETGYDSISLNHLNLWRSDCHFRVDDQYYGLEPVRIWRFSKKLTFIQEQGLHSQTHPMGLTATFHSGDYPVVHYGFATLDAILEKYANYYLHWQEGYPLDRLISEDNLDLQQIATYPGKLGSKFVAHNSCDLPKRIPPYHWRLLARKARNGALRTINPQLTIVCLIFQSTDWLAFAYGEALRLAREFKRGEVEILFVANDATQEVSGFLKRNLIPHIFGRGKSHPSEWYINSVYRSYNEGIHAAKAPWVYLINSDMAFANGALRAAFRGRAINSLITTRLIERGVLPSGLHAIEKDFGKSPSTFQRIHFERYAHTIKTIGLQSGGLYMPLLASKETLLQFGGFPEGNISESSAERYLLTGEAVIAEKNEPNIPGDRLFFSRLANHGLEHFTAFDSIAYHFQEGELRSKIKKTEPSGLAIMNDLVEGINGEEVLWGRIAKRYELDPRNRIFSTGFPASKLGAVFGPFKLWLQAWRKTRITKPRVVLSNGTYLIPSRFGLKNAILIQDRPSYLHLQFLQKISAFVSDYVFTNDLNYVAVNKRRNPIWLEIDSVFNEKLSASEKSLLPRKQSATEQQLRGVFIGAFNATKGFDLLEALIVDNPEVSWVLVSKIKDDQAVSLQNLPNVTIMTALDTDGIEQILLECDFLVSTSPWETQHLASMEAVALGLPVFITPTGLLGVGAKGLYPYGMVSGQKEYLSNFSVFLGQLHEFKVNSWRLQNWESGESEFYANLEDLLKVSFLPQALKSKSRIFLSRVESFVRHAFRIVLRRQIIPLLLKAKRKLSLK